MLNIISEFLTIGMGFGFVLYRTTPDIAVCNNALRYRIHTLFDAKNKNMAYISAAKARCLRHL